MQEQALFDKRISIALTPENAQFSLSAGGLLSLTLTKQDGTVEEFERVIPVRAFPITDPDLYICIREPDSRKKGKGEEIGMIERLADFDEQAQILIGQELDRRYFTPEVKKINSVKEKFGYGYWDCETTAGHIVFVLNNPFSNIRSMADGRVFINDIDGNCFTVSDPTKLDTASYKKLEIYL